MRLLNSTENFIDEVAILSAFSDHTPNRLRFISQFSVFVKIKNF